MDEATLDSDRVQPYAKRNLDIIANTSGTRQLNVQAGIMRGFEGQHMKTEMRYDII